MFFKDLEMAMLKNIKSPVVPMFRCKRDENTCFYVVPCEMWIEFLAEDWKNVWMQYRQPGFDEWVD